MIKLGIPVVDEHDLTTNCLYELDRNCSRPDNVEIIIIDNGSEHPYPTDKSQYNKSRIQAALALSVKISVIRNKKNRGYYWPLLQVANKATEADIVGLLHNDLYIYEQGWDRRLVNAFVFNPRLGMIGVCGSDEVDDRGGRGGGTMCNFAGRVGQLQEHTGKRITGLHQALLLDSMFMAMRKKVVEQMLITEHIPPCHFYDKIWPLRAHINGWFVGVLGLEVDHQGGRTSTGTRFECDCEDWCRQEGFDFEPGKASLVVYLEAERQFLTEFRNKGMIPSRIPSTWPQLI